MLATPQQAEACLVFVKQALRESKEDARLLQDPFFLCNLDYHFETLFAIYSDLYGYRNDCLESLVALIRTLAQSWSQRSPELKRRDKDRLLKPTWYMSNNMLGGTCYVDLYGGNLEGIRTKIPYFKDLGLTYLHLMPLFSSPEKQSDGGFAVDSYRKPNPKLGTLPELRTLARELHEAGICLSVDLVLNHTSKEHEWAKKAAAGDSEHSGYYWIFPDRTVPSEFEKTVRSVPTDGHNSSFIQLQDGRWIWSTFHSYQWDLNYSNPAVFRAMAGEMLFLANCGADVLKLDAASFIWKRMGTTCENLPEAHKLVRAFNAICRISAPSILFKSEAAMEHPAQVATFVDNQECQLSYNPLQMELGWEALATRRVNMLQQALERWHNLADADRCNWVNYVRSHEDIRWTFPDEDAYELLIHGPDHRHFLNTFYVNRYPGSFARGVPYQDNPKSGECRISGTAGSLAGLESGEEHAVERLLLLYSVAFSTGGIAMLYLGDEVGQLNDYSMLMHPDKSGDSRWVHRPQFPTDKYTDRLDRSTIAGKMFAGMRNLIALRKTTEELAGGRLMGFHTDNDHILGYQRFGPRSKILCLCNFHDAPQTVARDKFVAMPRSLFDLVTRERIELQPEGLRLLPHQFMWLRYD